MFSKHPAHTRQGPDYLPAVDPDIPSRSCCCPARPMVKIIMPPVPGREHPVDLWLCGHHYHASRAALLAAGADAIDLSALRDPGAEAGVPAQAAAAP